MSKKIMSSCLKIMSSRQGTKKGLQSRLTLKTSSKRRQPPTLPHCSTIGANGFNFSVRNGKRWDTAAITA